MSRLYPSSEGRELTGARARAVSEALLAMETMIGRWHLPPR